VTAERLHHASVEVPPALLPACTMFYRDALGIPQVPNLAGIAWFELANGDHVHLLVGVGGGEHAAHLALQVDDLATTLERCRGATAITRPFRTARE